MLEVGFPEAVFQYVILGREDVVSLMNNPLVRGASGTGTRRTVSAVASDEGKASIRRCWI